MTSTSSLILDQVVALIEPLTRFDRSSVQLRDESQQLLSCTGVWISSVAISSSISDGTGKLPSGVQNAGTRSGMERAIEETVAAERSNVARRIQSWCDQQAQSSPVTHKPLTSGDCISGITRIGYTWKCSPCGGHGKTTCSACNGAREVTCSHCHGAGRITCPQCQGKGTKPCSSCGGHSGRFVQVPIQYWNDATKQYSVRYESKWEFCHGAGCHGGQVDCFCIGGKVSCGPCLASGKVTCSNCHGQGEEVCKSCKGTGALHRIAATACQVTNTFAVHSGDFSEEDKRTTEKWDFQTFCQLATVTSNSPNITPSELRRTYSATLSRTQAHIQCAGQNLLLSGYGQAAKVFDFKGIVGYLLAGDLDQLRSTLSLRWGFLPFRNQKALRTAFASMLASELNQQLANPTQRAALVANRTVTEEHAVTTASCLRKAMGRLYSSTAIVGLAALFAVSYFTLYRLAWSGYMLPQSRPRAIVIFLAVVAITAVVAELLSCHFVLKRFPASENPASRKAARHLLRATGTLRRWRIAAAFTAVVAIICFFAVTLSSL